MFTDRARPKGSGDGTAPAKEPSQKHRRRKMTNWRIIVALGVLLAGCAGLQGTHRRDAASGYWRGEMDRMGWPEPFAVDIERDGEAFQGAWLSSPEVGSR